MNYRIDEAFEEFIELIASKFNEKNTSFDLAEGGWKKK